MKNSRAENDCGRDARKQVTQRKKKSEKRVFRVVAQLAPGCGPISVEVPRAPCPVQGLAPRGPRDQFGLDPRFCLASLILVAFYWRRVFSIALSPASRPFPRFLPTWFSCFRGNLCPRYAQLDLAGFILARSVVWHRFGRPFSWAETSVVPSSSVWGFFPCYFCLRGFVV